MSVVCLTHRSEWIYGRCAADRSLAPLVSDYKVREAAHGEGAADALQRLFEDLRITLVVVQRRPRRWQAFHTARLKTALTEPVRSARG